MYREYPNRQDKHTRGTGWASTYCREEEVVMPDGRRQIKLVSGHDKRGRISQEMRLRKLMADGGRSTTMLIESPRSTRPGAREIIHWIETEQGAEMFVVCRGIQEVTPDTEAVFIRTDSQKERFFGRERR